MSHCSLPSSDPLPEASTSTLREMEVVAGQPVAGSGTHCALLREDLDRYLSLSEYGAKQHIYNCYFRAQQEGLPPTCITCGRPTGSHPSASQQQLATVATRGCETSPSLNPSSSSLSSRPRLPMGLTVGNEVDTVYTPFSGAAFGMIGGLVCVAAFLLLTYWAMEIFSFDDAFHINMLTIIPYSALMGALVIALCARATSISIYKEEVPVRVTVTTKCLAGCFWREHLIIEDMRRTVLRVSNVHGARTFEVVVLDRMGGNTLITLFCGNEADATAEVGAWAAYLSARFGIVLEDHQSV